VLECRVNEVASTNDILTAAGQIMKNRASTKTTDVAAAAAMIATGVVMAVANTKANINVSSSSTYCIEIDAA
jgi:formiminotetrahydrofolate cyclodeaminase